MSFTGGGAGEGWWLGNGSPLLRCIQNYIYIYIHTHIYIYIYR